MTHSRRLTTPGSDLTLFTVAMLICLAFLMGLSIGGILFA